jgi:hypothetical protein
LINALAQKSDLRETRLESMHRAVVVFESRASRPARKLAPREIKSPERLSQLEPSLNSIDALTYSIQPNTQTSVITLKYCKRSF